MDQTAEHFLTQCFGIFVPLVNNSSPVRAHPANPFTRHKRQDEPLTSPQYPMIAFLKRILGVPVSRKDKECADSEWRKALWEQHQRDKFEQEEKRRLNSAATDMLGSWGWDFDKRTLADTISLLLTDRKTKTHLFSQYTEKLHYLAKKRVDGKVTKTLYIAQGAWQLNAAYVGHARAGLENGYEVSCCLVLSDYESVMPLHACPFPSPAEDVR